MSETNSSLLTEIKNLVDLKGVTQLLSATVNKIKKDYIEKLQSDINTNVDNITELNDTKVNRSGDTITGNLTMKGASAGTGQLRLTRSDDWPTLYFSSYDESYNKGYIQIDKVDNQFNFISNNPDKSDSSVNYYLPSPDYETGKKTHLILTSQNPVTIAQGGTNASDAITARENLGAAKGSYITFTTTATAGWHRIATTPSSIGNAFGLFQMRSATSSGSYSVSTTFIASTNYGSNASSKIKILDTALGSSPSSTKLRIVYNTTYSGNYAYLEVYQQEAREIVYRIWSIGGHNWSLINETGSIPSGYTYKEYALSQSQSEEIYNATLAASSWTQQTGYATYTLTVPNILSTSQFDVDLNMSDITSYTAANLEIMRQREEEWRDLIKAASANGSITFILDGTKPTVDLPIKIKWR